MPRSHGAEYRQQKERYWGKPVPEGAKHGQASFAAKVYGCDCRACLPSGRRNWKNIEGATGPVSKTERGRRLRANKRGEPVPPGTKHGRYTRKVYACKCDVCKNAENTARRAARESWRATAHGRWEQIGPYKTGIDVICWPPRDADPDWQCPDPSHQEAS